MAPVAEGSTVGTTFDLAAIQAINMPVEAQLKFYDVLGSDQTTPHMSVAWSWAFDTPFKWTKQVASFFGGTRQGMVISWPGHIKDVVASVRSSTTSSISCRRFSKPPASRHRRR